MFTSTPHFGFFWVFFLGFFSLGAQNAKTDVVLSIEKTRLDAMVQRDTNKLQQLLADDLLYIHSNALKEDKKEHIRSIASGKIVYQRMEREDATVRKYGKTAVVSGAIKVKGLFSGNPFDLKMLYTAIYRKNKSGWQLVHWQTTRLP
jgi:ketosteroid isomerase-like protein